MAVSALLCGAVALSASVGAVYRRLYAGLVLGALALLALLAAAYVAEGVALAAGCVGIGPCALWLCAGAVWLRFWGAHRRTAALRTAACVLLRPSAAARMS